MPLTRLNSEQLQAATAPSAHNLIIASAGTGKTSTIVGRIAHLLQSGIDPKQILLLTFTNKAAAEMLERVAADFGSSIASKIDAGTFHAISYRWLKRRDGRVMLKQQRELKTLFRSVYEKRSFHLLDGENSPFGAAYLYDQYLFYQNIEAVLSFEEWLVRTHEEHSRFALIYSDIVDEFETLKSRYGFLNFNDLLLQMCSLSQELELGYKEVLVDEYQDTNSLQARVIEAMGAESLFCVGDYDQSIYAFNGADISIISTFEKRYSDAKVYTLSKNYRSTAGILSLASKVISHNERIFKKSLEVTRDGDTVAPKLLIYDELFNQYHSIAKMISHSDTQHSQIAVIFRNNSSADGIETALRELDINSKRKGGVSFFDSKEIKAILDIYTLLVNQDDMMAFIHVVEYSKGIGSALAKELFVALQRVGSGSLLQGLFSPDTTVSDPFGKRVKNHQLGLFDDYLELGSAGRFVTLDLPKKLFANPILKHPRLNKESVFMLKELYTLLQKLQKLNNPTDIVKKIVDSELFKIIIESISRKRSQLKDGSIDEKLQLESKERIARKCVLLIELSRPYKEHDRFLNAMILGSSDLTQGEGVQLLSIHASKGLEYKDVYIVDLMDGRFPNRRLMSQRGSLDEERRLFYVAVTRAKDRLYLSSAKYDKIRKIEFVPSIFLYEAALLKKDENYRALVAKDSSS